MLTRAGLQAAATVALETFWPGREVEGDQDRERYETVAVALAEKLTEIEKRMGWVNVGAGRQRWDPSVPRTPEEEAAANARVRETVASGLAPMTPAWKPESVCATTGISKEMAEFAFPTREKWNAYLKATGKVETGGSELKGGSSGIARQAPPAHLRENVFGEAVEAAMAVLKAAGRITPEGDILPGAPVALPEAIEKRIAGLNGTNGTHRDLGAPDPTIREIAGAGGLDEDPAAAIETVPDHERTPAQAPDDFERSLGDLMKYKGRERFEALKSGAKPSDSGWSRKPFTG